MALPVRMRLNVTARRGVIVRAEAEAKKPKKENKLTREAKTEEVNTLTSHLEKLKATLVKLADNIAANEKSMAELDAAMAEATETRQKEKAKNEETIADAKEAMEAVAQAQAVLKEFYAKAAGDTELLQ